MNENQSEFKVEPAVKSQPYKPYCLSCLVCCLDMQQENTFGDLYFLIL